MEVLVSLFYTFLMSAGLYFFLAWWWKLLKIMVEKFENNGQGETKRDSETQAKEEKEKLRNQSRWTSLP